MTDTEFYQGCLTAWNEERLPIWVRHRFVNPSAKTQLRQFRRIAEASVDEYRRVLKVAKTKRWAREAKGLSMSNLGSNGKLFDYLEEYLTFSEETVGAPESVNTPLFEEWFDEPDAWEAPPWDTKDS